MQNQINQCPENSHVITIDLSDIAPLPLDLFMPKDDVLLERKFYLAAYQLIMRRNTITTLQPYIKAIGQIKGELLHLSLRENNLTKFPVEISVIPNLTTLSLARNNLLTIEDGVLPRIPSLQWLNLAKNSLSSLPKDISECTQLRGLELSNNQFRMFPAEVLSLPNLEALLLNDNKIVNLPSHLKFPECLDTLSLASNKLTEIPLSLIHSPPKNLVYLNLSRSAIKELPADFFSVGYGKLKTLEIHSCQLSTCPPWFLERLASRPCLSRLNLALNELKELPGEIGLLKQLNWFNVNGNPLDSLPPSLSALSGLVKLGIAQNNLREIPSLLFIHMQRLEKVDIRKTKIAYFPPSVHSTANMHRMVIKRESFVAHKAFPSFDLRSACKEHTDQPNYRGTVLGDSPCTRCHAFGGEIKELFFAGNDRLQYVTGIICESAGELDPIQVISLPAVCRLLRLNHHNSDFKTMKTALFNAILVNKEKGSNKTSVFTNMEYCDNPKFSNTHHSTLYLLPHGFHTFDTHTQEEKEAIERKVRDILQHTPSLQETAVSVRLKSTQSEFLNGRYKDYKEYFKNEQRIDHNPKRTRHFINQSLPSPGIPEHLVEKAIAAYRQCDACLKWYGDSKIMVGYRARSPSVRHAIPIRYHVCSFGCALDSLVRFYKYTREWQETHIGFDDIDEEEEENPGDDFFG